MSRKIKKKKKSVSPSPQKKKAKRTVSKRLVAVIIIAALTLAFLVASAVAIIRDLSSFDYDSANLSSYLFISDEDYRGFSFDIEKREAGEDDVLKIINSLLTKNKTKTPEYNGQGIINLPITLGDVAKIYYRGYTVDENGNEADFISNLFSQSPKGIEIGSGDFIEGLDEALLGVIPKEYQRTLTKVSEGYVAALDVVYLSYKALYPDGSTASVSGERIDLRLPNLDAKYGVGFKSFMLGSGSMPLKINEQIKEQKILPYDENGSVIYYDMQVDFVIRENKAPLTVSITLSESYNDANMRGKEVKFDLYIDSVVFYETPEYNEEFIISTLKIKREDLAAYGGDDVVIQHKAMLYEEANAKIEAQWKAAFESAAWDYLLSKTVFTSLPEKEVKGYYNSEYETVQSAYTYYAGAYKTFGDFAKAYYGLSNSEAWRDHITSLAEKTVKQKLLLYYILRDASLVPSAEEYSALYEEVFEEYLADFIAANQAKLDACKTDEEYDKLIKDLRRETLDYYGDDFFKTSVYYRIVVDNIILWSIK